MGILLRRSLYYDRKRNPNCLNACPFLVFVLAYILWWWYGDYGPHCGALFLCMMLTYSGKLLALTTIKEQTTAAEAAALMAATRKCKYWSITTPELDEPIELVSILLLTLLCNEQMHRIPTIEDEIANNLISRNVIYWLLGLGYSTNVSVQSLQFRPD